VKIILEIKNVENLEVKVFECLTENFYLNQKREFDDHIDLDGLIPHLS